MNIKENKLHIFTLFTGLILFFISNETYVTITGESIQTKNLDLNPDCLQALVNWIDEKYCIKSKIS